MYIILSGIVCQKTLMRTPVLSGRCHYIFRYPPKTGAGTNHGSLHEAIPTFAQVLRENGYHTSYLGKWHLARAIPGEREGDFVSKKKKSFDFGFTNRDFQHPGSNNYRTFHDLNETHYQRWTMYDKDKPQSAWTEENYGTDFFFRRTIEIIEKQRKIKNTPFSVMMSLEDPHYPYVVRQPYDTMFKDMKFQVPPTMQAAIDNNPRKPKWRHFDETTLSITEYRYGFQQEDLQVYYGMIKNIDDNLGRLLKYLKDKNLEKNTVVVFTSDHGGMNGEHGVFGKLKPYSASVNVPFLIRYPGKIMEGKVIKSATSNIDFAPSLLNMVLGSSSTAGMNFDGTDRSKHWLDGNKVIDDPNQIVYSAYYNNNWFAAITSELKLVISPTDYMWLFDLVRDPDELYNFRFRDDYSKRAEHLRLKAVTAMKVYDWRMSSSWACKDDPTRSFHGRIKFGHWNCRFLARLPPVWRNNFCNPEKSNANEVCPDTCRGHCTNMCQDKPETYINYCREDCNIEEESYWTCCNQRTCKVLSWEKPSLKNEVCSVIATETYKCPMTCEGWCLFEKPNKNACRDNPGKAYTMKRTSVTRNCCFLSGVKKRRQRLNICREANSNAKKNCPGACRGSCSSLKESWETLSGVCPARIAKTQSSVEMV